MSASAENTGGLRAGVLQVRHAVITSLAVITPAGAILFLPIPIAASAGAAMPLSIIIAFAAVFLIMNAIYRFTQRIAHAGSFFAFVRDSLGIRWGFLTGWLFLAFYPVLVVLDLVLLGASVQGIITAHGGPEINWWIFMLGGLVLIWGVTILGIRLSVRFDLTLLLFEAVVLVALAITILFRVHGGALRLTVFNPSHSSTGFSGVALGAVFGVLAFTGFEAAAYLGEEARQPRRTIPRAILVTLVLVGLTYVFFFYVVTVGYGLGNMDKLASDPAPWDTLGLQYWNSGATILVDIASVVALLAGGVAATNGSARMLFALGRDGLLPRALGRTSKRFRTPHVALTLMFIASVVLGLAFGLKYSPLPAFTLLSLVVTLNALAVYALLQIAVVVYFRRNGGFNVIWHLVVPVLAVAVIVYLYWKSVSPTPAYPSNVAIWFAIGWAALGLVAMFGLSTLAPNRLAEAAAIIGEDEVDLAAGYTVT